jgi:hypothetical protein
MNYTVDSASKRVIESRKISSNNTLISDTLVSSVDQENAIYLAQLKEMVCYFSSIHNSHIRQYCVNLLSTISNMGHDVQKIKEYIDDIKNKKIIF